MNVKFCYTDKHAITVKCDNIIVGRDRAIIWSKNLFRDAVALTDVRRVYITEGKQ